MKTNKMKAAVSLLYSIAVAMLIGVAASLTIGANAFAVGGAVMGAPLAKKAIEHGRSVAASAYTETLAYMAVQQEFWVDYVIGNLFKDSSFVSKSYDESQYVIGGSVVHVPQAGAKVGVTKNRSSLPGTVVQRTDTDVTYALDIYDTDPQLITNPEQLEVSYDKANSVLGEQMATLEDTIADNLLYNWVASLPTGQILRTNGSTVATSLAPSATGTRKALVKEDLKAAQALMNKQNIPRGNRYALIPSDMYQELMSDTTLNARDGVNGGELDLKNGIVLNLYGFKIMERSETTLFSNATPPAAKLPTAAGAATDNQAVICWDAGCVTRAQGSVKAFEQLNSPVYYGDIFSVQNKMGGRRRRTDSKGVVAIVQTLVS